MVTCSYCDAELPRHIFCKPSHKVLYHRKKLPLSKPLATNSEKISENNSPILTMSKQAIKTLSYISSEHDFGLDGKGICFKCNPPHHAN